MFNVIIEDTNLNGQFAEITFCPASGGTIYLGYHQLPFTWITDYYDGDFSLYFPSINKTCGNCASPPVTPTVTVTPSQTPSCGPCFGYLYNFYAVTGTSSQSITSSDVWSVPTDTDFLTLVSAVASSANSLRLVDTTTYWNNFNTNATNSFGFNSIGSGQRSGTDGSFFNIKSSGVLMSKTEVPFAQQYIWDLTITSGNDSLGVSFGSFKTNGFAVRLVKNTTTLLPGQTGTYIGNDGKIYDTICIGTQEWLSENLRETRYRGGTTINYITDNNAWTATTTGALSIYNNDYQTYISGCDGCPTPTPTPTSTFVLTPTPTVTPFDGLCAKIVPLTPSVTPSHTPTPTASSTPGLTPSPTPTKISDGILGCITDLVIEVMYINDPNDLNYIPSNYNIPNSYGNHVCNRALSEIYINNVYIGDARMNNLYTTGQLTGSTTTYGTYICGDYFNLPDYLDPTGTWRGSQLSRYNRYVISSLQAQQIAANSTSNNLIFTLRSAIATYGVSCDGLAVPHDDVSYVRITKLNGTLIYEGVPGYNITSIPVCPCNNCVPQVIPYGSIISGNGPRPGSTTYKGIPVNYVHYGVVPYQAPNGTLYPVRDCLNDPFLPTNPSNADSNISLGREYYSNFGSPIFDYIIFTFATPVNDVKLYLIDGGVCGSGNIYTGPLNNQFEIYSFTTDNSVPTNVKLCDGCNSFVETNRVHLQYDYQSNYCQQVVTDCMNGIPVSEYDRGVCAGTAIVQISNSSPYTQLKIAHDGITNPNLYLEALAGIGVYFCIDSEPNSTPSPTITPTQTPNPTPTPTPTPPIQPLFDRSTFIGKVSEPYLTWLNQSCTRWETYIKFNPSIYAAIQSLIPGWNGIRLGSYSLYNNPSSGVIASCGVTNLVDIIPGNTGGVQMNTTSFLLNINDSFRNTYNTQDWINILTHELGHALGIGQFWQNGFVIYGAVPPVNNFLNGSAYSNAQNAYNSIVGQSRIQIPLEDMGGSGTQSAHWENDYRNASAAGSGGVDHYGVTNELMVGFYFSGLNPKLSTLSIKILVDFGYEEVSVGASEGNPGIDTSLVAGNNITSMNNLIEFKCDCKDHTNIEKVGTIYMDSSNNFTFVKPAPTPTPTNTSTP